ncbi:hypothetical protein [Streptomyces platensis]|uniref:nSTAND1 domain-containing NTPase n=1 Tax=Streptomyces platensis TaxID=58346 RepID=UPI0039B74E65
MPATSGLTGVLRDARTPGLTNSQCRKLREAIVKPAAAHSLILEPELTARIIEEVADEPGALPLMSHALRETCRRRRTGTDDPGSRSGRRPPLRHRPHRRPPYPQLTPPQAETARRIVLRLVAPGEGIPDPAAPSTRPNSPPPIPARTPYCSVWPLPGWPPGQRRCRPRP